MSAVGPQRRTGLIAFAVKGLASGIGLASEAVTHHKEKKKAEQAGLTSNEGVAATARDHDAPPQYTVSEGDMSNAYPQDKKVNPYIDQEPDTLEQEWALDDAQDDLTRTPSEEQEKEKEKENSKPIRDVAKLTEIFLQAHPVPPATSIYPLPLPVILPQRRPKARSRGFVRAYAPVLMSAEIDQQTWLEFLELFDKASEASPWLNAINLASLAGSFLPHGISIAISLAVQVGVNIAIEMQSRQRANTFLDNINDSFFRPRGLYCLIMTWRPDSGEVHQSVNLSSAISKKSSAGMMQKFQPSSGKTYGDFAFPEVAPLVWPAIEDLAKATGEDAEKKKSKLKNSKNFIENYMDRRAQAEYQGDNPDSLLAGQVEKPKFTSRYADPNHPASNGSLVSLVTAGKVNLPRLGGGRGGLLGLGGLGGGPGLLGRGMGQLGRGSSYGQNQGPGPYHDQYQNQGPGPYPDEKRGPYPDQYQNQGPGPYHDPYQNQGPGQYPSEKQGPYHNPYENQGPGQYPNEKQGPYHNPYENQGPGQYPDEKQGPYRNPYEKQGPAYPNEKQGPYPDQYQNQGPGPYHDPYQNQGPGPYPNEKQGPYHEQYPPQPYGAPNGMPPPQGPGYYDPNQNQYQNPGNYGPGPGRGGMGMYGGRGGGLLGTKGLLAKGVSKVLGHDVIYLMIVKMPSAEEMAAAMAQR